MWDAIGSEFGARHELYEMNYAGSHELIRLFALQQAQVSGSLKEMEALVERCMADYDEDGWKDPAYHDSDGRLGAGQARRSAYAVVIPVLVTGIHPCRLLRPGGWPDTRDTAPAMTTPSQLNARRITATKRSTSSSSL